MRFTTLSAALFALLCGAGLGLAQNVRDIPGPRETPPASFKGPQYVDSGGCVFVRAGVDGRVIWVPRVNAQHKVLCGYPPTALAAAAPPTTVVAVAAPAPPVAQTVQPKPKPAAQATVPKAKRQVPDDYVAAPVAGSQPGTLRCPARAPIATRAPLRGGGTVVLCLSRSGILDEQASVATLDAVSPVSAPLTAPANAVLVCPRAAPVAQRVPQRGGGSTLLCTAGDGSLNGLAMPKRRATETKVARIAVPLPTAPDLLHPVVPAGYKLAWQDGRLNSNRGRGTAAGQLAQDQVWTRQVPARLVTRSERQVRVTVSTQDQAPTLRISTSGQADTATYVQVGSFGQPANARAAQARLAALGLPVARATRGKLELVMAGPFDNDDDAKRALKAARRGGFPDAVLR